MKTLITSNKRHDLLQETLDSFWDNQYFDRIRIKLHEDEFFDEDGSLLLKNICYQVDDVSFTEKIGQHKSIEKFIDEAPDNKYYLHLENDWHFTNTYNWIQASIDIMEADPKVIKVLARKDSPHLKMDFFGTVNVGGFKCVNIHELRPWENNGINWKGFSWNPGVTRLDLLRQFAPFGKHEQDVADAVHTAGYKVVALEQGVYTHIGEGRSTHV